MEESSADRGYDTSENNSALYDDHGIKADGLGRSSQRCRGWTGPEL